MRITLESTSKLVEVDVAGYGHVPARIWEGVTESGIPVHCYITRIAVRADLDTSQFDAELQSHREPSAEIAAIPNRLIL